VNDNSSHDHPPALHQRLGDLSIEFHQLQNELLEQPESGHRQRLEAVADSLVLLCEECLEQVIGELFLSEYSSYNFTKPLYIAASLLELIRRLAVHDASKAIAEDKRQQMVIAALGHNLGLMDCERQIYADIKDLTLEQKKQLRADYPQQSAEMLKAAGLDQALIEDVVRNHNVATDNPSRDAMLMRTAFIYAGIAMPQKLSEASQAIDNPSREFARMYANNELDPIYGGLFLKINGLAPIGSIVKLESNEKVMVLTGPGEEDIGSSKVRMLANRNGVQLKWPGEIYQLNKTPSRHRGLADHHHFAWTCFSPHEMWQE
jgi:hypothetical protein